MLDQGMQCFFFNAVKLAWQVKHFLFLVLRHAISIKVEHQIFGIIWLVDFFDNKQIRDHKLIFWWAESGTRARLRVIINYLWYINHLDIYFILIMDDMCPSGFDYLSWRRTVIEVNTWCSHSYDAISQDFNKSLWRNIDYCSQSNWKFFTYFLQLYLWK